MGGHRAAAGLTTPETENGWLPEEATRSRRCAAGAAWDQSFWK